MGASSGRGSVITLAKLDELEVDTDVKEDFLGQIRKGQPTEVVVDAVPDRRYRGKLREIIPMGDRTRGIVKVKVAILNPDERLFPELSATVHFLPDQKEGEANLSERKAVFAPVTAIQGEGDEKFAWVVENDRVRKLDRSRLPLHRRRIARHRPAPWPQRWRASESSRIVGNSLAAKSRKTRKKELIVHAFPFGDFCASSRLKS
jgi:multidrug efflux pump subunit AcrA (membrane-fusion protein)